MDDLLKRLRDDSWRSKRYCFSATELQVWHDTCLDAAREIELLRSEVAELKEQLEAAGDGDTWKAAAKRCEAEIEQLQQRIRFTPSPEQWQEVQSQLAASREEVERLRTALERIRDHNMSGITGAIALDALHNTGE